MLSKKIIIGNRNKEDLFQKIREFSEIRDYILNERDEGAVRVFEIYDQSLKSGMIEDVMGFFVGNSFLPSRIRIEARAIEMGEELVVTVKGDVMMNVHNYIKYRPNRKDTVKCRVAFNSFIDSISTDDNAG